MAMLAIAFMCQAVHPKGAGKNWQHVPEDPPGQFHIHLNFLPLCEGANDTKIPHTVLLGGMSNKMFGRVSNDT